MGGAEEGDQSPGVGRVFWGRESRLAGMKAQRGCGTGGARFMPRSGTGAMQL